jgi:single-stranded-DNA-specific exonuclease
MTWTKKEISPSDVRKLTEKYGLDPLTSSVLVRRGVNNPSDLPFYLEEDLRLCHNPFLFDQMEEAVERIHQAVDEEEKILVFGDGDVDGITATVLVCEALRQMGLAPEWKIPQENETYGLSETMVRDFAARNGTLIITVDCGISSFKEIAIATELGIDTIILDHHNKEAEGVPSALAVINPKITGSTYPFSGLCGCAVASKWLWALCFSRTDFYNRSIILLHAEAVDGKYLVNMARVENLIIKNKISLDMDIPVSRDRFIDFTGGTPLVVFDKREQLLCLKNIFGSRTDIFLLELKEDWDKTFPGIRGASLGQLREKSRLLKYQETPADCLDTLMHVYISLFEKKEEHRFAPWFAALDLVAMGTIADLMPLTGENRILVRKGLEVMSRSERPSTRELLLKLKLMGQPLTNQEISWQVGPFLNSAGRMGRGELPVQMFLTDDQSERMTLIEEINRLNRERKKLSDDLMDSVLSEATAFYDDTGKTLALCGDRRVLRGITGILATRLCRYFSAPSIVLAYQGSIVSGSIRSSGELDIPDLFNTFSDILLDYGGHDCAAGFSFPAPKLEEFQKRLRQYGRNLVYRKKEEELLVDAEIPFDYLGEEIIKTVERLAPYGNEFPPLTFLSRKMIVENAEVIGKGAAGHLKLLLSGGKYKWPAMLWDGADRYKKDFVMGDSVDIVYRVKKNLYQNRENYQMVLADIKRSV